MTIERTQTRVVSVTDSGKFRSWGRWVLVPLLTIIVFYLLFQRIDAAEVILLLGHVSTLTWVIASALTLSFPALSAIRWRLILRTMGYHVSLSRCLLVVIGIWPLSTVSPFKAGDLLRAVGLRREMKIAVATGSVLSERVLDVLMLAGLAVAGGLWYGNPRISVVAGGVLLIVISGFGAARLHMRWPIDDKFQTKLQDLFLSMRTLGQQRFLLTAIVLITASRWVLAILQTQVLFQSVGANVTLGFTAAALPIAIFVGLFPVTIAGMGTRDTALVVLFSGFATAPQALAVGLLYSFFGYWLLTILGLPFTKRALAY